MLYTENSSKLIKKLDVGTHDSRGRSVIDSLVILCQQGLTLRSLMNVCEAVSMRPTARMLKLALANSIPGLKNLPQEHVDPNFYLDIAKRFFSDINAEMETQIRRQISDEEDDSYNACFNGLVSPPSGIVQDPNNPEIYLGAFPLSADKALTFWCPIAGIKKGREFIKKVLLEWRDTFAEVVDAPATNSIDNITCKLSAINFIDNVIWKLDNVHVFQYIMIHGEYEASIREVGLIGFGKEISGYTFDEYFLEPPIYRVREAAE